MCWVLGVDDCVGGGGWLVVVEDEGEVFEQVEHLQSREHNRLMGQIGIELRVESINNNTYFVVVDIHPP